MSTAPTSYTATDYADIYAYYYPDGTVDLQKIADEIAKAGSDPTYEPAFSVGDLLSFYIDESGGQLPSCMTDGLSDPESLAYLWADEDFVEVVQDWRSYNKDDESLETLISQLESFLTMGEEYGTLSDEVYQFTSILDAQDVVDDYALAHPETSTSSSGSDDGTLSFDTATLMTNAQTIALMIGMGPGMAILFYLMGSQTYETVPDSVDDLPEYMEDNGDGTVTIHTENGDITAALGETVYFQTSGFASKVEDLNSTILDKYEDNMDDIDEVIDEMEDLDPEDSEYQADFKRLEEELSAIKNGNEILTNCFEISFDIFENLIEAASALIDRQTRTWGSIVNRY